jgi:hypothetical protein
MCSTKRERLAKIGTAIDELAADARARAAAAASEGHEGQADDVAGRLAQLWAMIAELDPEVSRRLPGYGG